MSTTIASCFLAFAVGFIATLVVTAIYRNFYSIRDSRLGGRKASRVTFTLRCTHTPVEDSDEIPASLMEEVDAIFAVTNETVEKLEWLLHCGNRTEALSLLVENEGVPEDLAEAALDLIDAPVYGSYH